jgi:ABC-type branched-subunit amino acid transport system substrate-binding protein
LNSQNWKRVSIVYTDEPYGQGLTSYFVEEASKNNITIISSRALYLGGPASGYANTISALQSSDSRIIVYFGPSAEYRELIKVASSAGIYGKGYAWIGTDALATLELSYPEEIQFFAGTIYLFPLEKQGVEGSKFDEYYSENRLNTSFVLANLSTVGSPAAYSYFYTSCLDLVVLGLDRLLKSNSSFTVSQLLDGQLNNKIKYPDTFSFPNHE